MRKSTRSLEGSEQGEDGSAVPPSGGSRGQRSGGVDWDRTGEGISVAVVAPERAGKQSTPAHGLGSSTGLYQSLLFLFMGFRVGWMFLEDQCLCAVSHLAVA